ncbi:MAG: hypothetical protein HC893_09285, partial [Chloroflexaceae bacterium]|nr:hypothetical protein [Chloroflexaceae bacterium]
MSDELSALQRQLKNFEENLALIQERKSEFVMSTDIPLQMVKAESDLEKKIAQVKAKIATFLGTPPPADPAPVTSQYASGQNIAQASGGSTATVSTNQSI